jgi:hypothetical protein
VQQMMREMVTTAAQKADMMPDTERVIVAFRFWYQPWEDQTRLPTQILMSADRKSGAAGQMKEEVSK